MGFTGNAPAGVGIEQARSENQTCLDINECLSPEDNLCDPNAECINLKVFRLFVSFNTLLSENVLILTLSLNVVMLKIWNFKM